VPALCKNWRRLAWSLATGNMTTTITVAIPPWATNPQPPLRCQRYPPMNDSHLPWTSSRGQVTPAALLVTGAREPSGQSERPRLYG
jgi:hypothetical protein